MNSNRYVVEYFAEGSDSMDTMFVEAPSKERAKNVVVDKCGAFVNIVACNLTKSAGGEGAEFQPVVHVNPEVYSDEPLTSMDAEGNATLVKAPKAIKEKVVKEPKAPKVPKEPKVEGEPRPLSLAAQTRAILKECNEAGATDDVKTATIAERLGMDMKKARGYMTWYTKRM